MSPSLLFRPVFLGLAVSALILSGYNSSSDSSSGLDDVQARPVTGLTLN